MARPFVTHHHVAGHRPVPADLARAVPQAPAGRRAGARLRDRPELPQRGHRPRATTPSSRCSRSTRPTATTSTMMELTQDACAAAAARRHRIDQRSPSAAASWTCGAVAADHRPRFRLRGGRRGGHAGPHGPAPRSPNATASRVDPRGARARSRMELYEKLVEPTLLRADVRHGLPARGLTARPAAPHEPGLDRARRPRRRRHRARDGLLRAHRPHRAAREVRAPARGEAPATRRPTLSTRTSSRRWNTACRRRAALASASTAAHDPDGRGVAPRPDPVPPPPPGNTAQLADFVAFWPGCLGARRVDSTEVHRKLGSLRGVRGNLRGTCRPNTLLEAKLRRGTEAPGRMAIGGRVRRTPWV